MQDEILQFKDGATVRTADNEKVGHIERVVLNPQTNEVSHLVVMKGFMFPEDKVVPVAYVEDTNSDRVLLNKKKAELELPPFEEMHFVSLEDEDLTEEEIESATHMNRLYSYPMTATTWMHSWPAVYTPDSLVVREKNIPEDAIVLDNNAAVFSSDGEKVGTVHRVFVGDDQRVTHIVISRGLFFKTEKLVPVVWIMDAMEGEVHLNVHSKLLRRLPDFNEDMLELAPDVKQTD